MAGTATAPTALRTEADFLAEQIVLKGRGWKARELVIELREPVDGKRGPDDPIPVRMSSEREVERYDWWNDEVYVEILDHGKVDLSYARDGLPFCLDHWTGRQIGLVENVRVENKELVGEVRFGNHPDAAWVRQDILEGIRKKVSIGYVQGDYEVVNPKRKKGEVEIRRYAWMVYESSSVCIPADYEMGFGRGLLRALRSSMSPSPGEARKGKESEMAGSATAAPDAGVATEELERANARAADEQLRVKLLNDLEHMGATAEQRLGWITGGTSVKDAKEQLRAAADEDGRRRREEAPVRTGAAPDVFVRSPAGAIGRDGKVKESRDTFGFDSPGEFFQAVRFAATRKVVDPRFERAHEMFRAASGQTGVIDSEGGFAVPPQFNAEIFEPVYSTGSIMSRVDRLPISGNALEQNLVDETSRVKGSRWGAVTHTWGGETDNADTSKVKLRRHRWALNALTLRGFVTDDELEDAPALGATLVKALRGEAVFAAEDAVFNGTGDGRPLGITRSDALVTVAIEGSQTIANTSDYIAKNVVKMLARMPTELEAGAAWFSHRDIRSKLLLATLGGASAVSGIYIAPGMLAATPKGGILGFEHLVTEYNEAEGTVGDLVFAQLNQYRWVEKSAVPTLSTSAHVRFWENEMCFKARWRVDGGPLWRTSVTPAKGSNKVSPFIALAARS